MGKGKATDAETIARFRRSWRRRLADIDYFRNEQMGWREGTIVVWAGMRGAVTLAAAQTLPRDTPSRSLLVFIAFLVAAASLLIQGSTLPWLARKLLPQVHAQERAALERARLSVVAPRGRDRRPAKNTAWMRSHRFPTWCRGRCRPPTPILSSASDRSIRFSLK